MFKPYIMKIDGVRKTVGLKEYEPQNYLTLKDGKIYNGDKRFRSFGVNLVGYAVTHSDPSYLARFLDQLEDMGVRMIRVLHLGGYQPLYSEVESSWDKLDTLVDMLSERQMYLWYNIQHRQRLLETDPHDDISVWPELWGTRPAGILKGEINDLAFWDTGLLNRVKEHAVKFVNRYASKACVGVISFINEKTAVRSKAYFPAGGMRNPPTEYEKIWFDKWNKWNAVAKTAGKKADINRFLSDVDSEFFKEMNNCVRNAGYKGLTNCTSFFGDSHLSCLSAMRNADIIDLHIYPENNLSADPFIPSLSDRTFLSTISSLHFKDRAIACTEWGSVYQNGATKGQKSNTWLSAPIQLAKWAVEQDMDLCFQYASYSNKLNDANISVYDSFKDPNFILAFEEAVKFFNDSNNDIPRNEVEIILSPEIVYGYIDINKVFTTTVPGSQPTIKLQSVNNRTYIKL